MNLMVSTTLIDEFPSPKACSVAVSPLQIHCRLGHPSLDKLKKLVPSLNGIDYSETFSPVAKIASV